MILARAPEAPWALIIVLGAIVAMCLLDRLPARSFYSRRAFEPRPRTYDELEHTQVELETPLRGELRRPQPELRHPPGRELEPW